MTIKVATKVITMVNCAFRSLLIMWHWIWSRFLKSKLVGHCVVFPRLHQQKDDQPAIISKAEWYWCV